jgi:hypothetical protein
LKKSARKRNKRKMIKKRFFKGTWMEKRKVRITQRMNPIRRNKRSLKSRFSKKNGLMI